MQLHPLLFRRKLHVIPEINSQPFIKFLRDQELQRPEGHTDLFPDPLPRKNIVKVFKQIIAVIEAVPFPVLPAFRQGGFLMCRKKLL